LPSSRPASAASIASRASPWLAGPKLSRTSQASLMARARSLVMSNPEAVEEGTEIPGFMIDMGFGRNGKFWPLAGPVALAVQPDGGHAQLMRHHQIAGDVVEHGGLGWRHAARFHHRVIGGLSRLGHKADGANVPHFVEGIGQRQPLQNTHGVIAAA